MRCKTFLRLLSLVRPFWRGMALSVLLGVLTIASSVGLMATSAWMISKAGLQPSIAELGISVVAVRFFGLARGVFRYLERLVSHDTTFRLLADLRVTFYRAIEPLAPAHFSQFHTGDLLDRAVADVETLQDVYLRVIAPPLVAMLTAALMTLFFLGFDPFVALVLLASLLISAIGLPLLAWWMARKRGEDTVAIRAKLNTALVDNIQGLADSLVYGQTTAQLDHLNQLSDELAVQEKHFANLEGLQAGLAALAVNGAALAVLAVAIPRIDGIYLAAVTLATIAAFEAITPLALAAQNLSANTAAAQRLFELVDMKPLVTDPNDLSPSPKSCNLDIRNLSFRYASDETPVFENFSLSIPYGQKIVIMGTSGSGKSSLVNLLLRFWNYESGEIWLGEHELRTYHGEDVRRIFTVMTQRTYLFNTSIRENIRIARPDAHEEAIMLAAQKAQLHDFIAALPDGYDTIVGENGAKLSGGERQRIALARVLLRNAPIWILDEATANLDAVTERAVMQTIFDSAENRTLIILTHRLVLPQRVDRVISL